MKQRNRGGWHGRGLKRYGTGAEQLKLSIIRKIFSTGRFHNKKIKKIIHSLENVKITLEFAFYFAICIAF